MIQNNKEASRGARGQDRSDLNDSMKYGRGSSKRRKEDETRGSANGIGDEMRKVVVNGRVMYSGLIGLTGEKEKTKDRDQPNLTVRYGWVLTVQLLIR